MRPSGSRRKLAVHGPAVELEAAVPALEKAIDAMLGSFVVPEWPDGFVPIAGSLRPYDPGEVARYLSPSAKHLARTDDLLDVYEEGERFWLVDDRWGMTEINLLRNQWRSWIVPQPKLDPIRVVEYSILWPLAQLVRGRGVHLLPAVSVVRDGFAALILCPFGLEPELSTMILAGYRVIGQRWTALREEDGRVALLHMPGRVERSITPRLREGNAQPSGWFNLMEEECGAWQNHAFCDAVLISGPGRRPGAHVREISSADAIHALRRAWPIVELHPARRQSQIAAKLAQSCRTAEIQFSRNSKELLALLNTFRFAAPADSQIRSVAA